MRHRALDLVTSAVQLVPVAQVLPAHLRLGVDKVGVQIAIRLLCADHLIHHLVNKRCQLRIGGGGKRIAGCLDPLGRIRIAEDQHDRRGDYALEVQVEDTDAARLLEFAVNVRDGRGPVGLDPQSPEGIVKAYSGKGNKVELTSGRGHACSVAAACPACSVYK